MLGDARRGDIARNLIRVRAARRQHFPSDLFDEHAWDILLHLFGALTDNETVSENDLIERAGVSMKAGRRWLSHLGADGQIESRQDGDDVAMTPRAITAMRGFLDTAGAIHAYNQAHDSRDQ